MKIMGRSISVQAQVLTSNSRTFARDWLRFKKRGSPLKIRYTGSSMTGVYSLNHNTSNNIQIKEVLKFSQAQWCQRSLAILISNRWTQETKSPFNLKTSLMRYPYMNLSQQPFNIHRSVHHRMSKVVKIDRVIQEITKRIHIVLSIKVALKNHLANNNNSKFTRQGKVKKDHNQLVNSQCTAVRMHRFKTFKVSITTPSSYKQWMRRLLLPRTTLSQIIHHSQIEWNQMKEDLL